jgi:hypothetical protein
MGISIKVEDLPDIGEWIVFTLCDHTNVGMIDRVVSLLESETPEMASLSCQPTGIPMHIEMVTIMADNLERALAQVTDTSSAELIFAEQGKEDDPKFRLFLGTGWGMVLEVRVDTPVMLDGTHIEDPYDKRTHIRGDVPFERVPELLASMREEISVYLSRHPKADA